jgi:thiamine biosynthesis lipoprotein
MFASTQHWIVLAVLAVGIGIDVPPLAAEPDVALRRFAYSEQHMGMDFKLILYSDAEDAANRAAQAAYARIAALNLILSDYDRASELMQICHGYKVGEPVAVSAELFAVLRSSQQLAERTAGRFDVTIGPLTQLWRRSRRQQTLPTDDLLARQKQRVGYKSLTLDETARTVTFHKPDMLLDLGGIAAGYACDEAAKILREMGITLYLIDSSGDVLVSGPPPGAPAWRVAVAPLEVDGPPTQTIRLNRGSVTTSGDAFRYVEINGTRYSHIVDPETGLGLTTRMSATVIAPTAIEADSLATAVNLLGPQKGLELIENTPDAAVLLVWQEDGATKTSRSKRWVELSGAENP